MVHFPVLIMIRRLWEWLGFAQWQAVGHIFAFTATVVLILVLADTYNGPQAVMKCSKGLFIDQLIGFTKVGAPFRVAKNNRAAQFTHHHR